MCGLMVLVVLETAGCGAATGSVKMNELQRVTAGALDIILLSDHDALRHGKDAFRIEFKSKSDGALVDVGNVRVTAYMPMPGMAMFGNIDVQRTDVPGQYQANGQFDMAGTWRKTVEWDWPAGPGSVTFSGAVQ